MMEPKSLAPPAELGDLLPDGQPTGLDVTDIRKHDPAHCEHADVFLTGYPVADSFDPGEQGAFVLERPGNERDETFSVGWFFGLHFAQPNQMLKTLFKGFHMTEHHGGGSSQP
jgi:hypothetical protein